MKLNGMDVPMMARDADSLYPRNMMQEAERIAREKPKKWLVPAPKKDRIADDQSGAMDACLRNAAAENTPLRQAKGMFLFWCREATAATTPRLRMAADAAAERWRGKIAELEVSG